jgi:cytochrome c553
MHAEFRMRASLISASIGALSLTGASYAASERVDELIQAALQLDVDAERGGRIYREHCASCHGQKGHGDPQGNVPALAGQRQAYVIKQLADFSELERDSPTMHGVVSRADLSDPQVWADVASYVNSLAPIARPQLGDGRYVELGEAIFREQCSSCHEADARGDDDGFVPSLRNQHYAYLLNEMRTIARWHSRNLDDDLERFLDSLDEDEMIGLADYLSRQHGPTKDRLRMRDDGSVGD